MRRFYKDANGKGFIKTQDVMEEGNIALKEVSETYAVKDTQITAIFEECCEYIYDIAVSSNINVIIEVPEIRVALYSENVFEFAGYNSNTKKHEIVIIATLFAKDLISRNIGAKFMLINMILSIYTHGDIDKLNRIKNIVSWRLLNRDYASVIKLDQEVAKRNGNKGGGLRFDGQ